MKLTTYGAVWFLESHSVDNESTGTDEENLHAGVIERYVVHEEINISHAEYNQKDLLSLA